MGNEYEVVQCRGLWNRLFGYRSEGSMICTEQADEMRNRYYSIDWLQGAGSSKGLSKSGGEKYTLV